MTTHTPLFIERSIEKLIEAGSPSDDTDLNVLLECARRYIVREAEARALSVARTSERPVLLDEEGRSKLQARVSAIADEIAEELVVDWSALLSQKFTLKSDT
jgi:hypothetical protein